MEARDSFGYWVRCRRKSLDLTQEELAQRVGCAPVTVRKIEADERRPSPQMAERLALCLAVPASELPRFVAAAVGEKTLAWLEHPPGSVRSKGNLPAPVTSLVGREREIDEIAALLQRGDVRLLTLTGPIGVGKTRLAVEVGRRLKTLRDGVFLVELAAVRTPDLVLPAIATTFGIREGRAGALAQLLEDHLAARELLLILDNFEHLLGAATQVASLLAHCPHLRVLVTSRARLHLYGEHELVVAPLSVPDTQHIAEAAESAAVRLFCDRARAARADFRLTPSLTSTVLSICRHLDGLPLAIELAAARIKLFAPQELLQRLDHRLPSTTSPHHDPLPRLRVLEEAIRWSYGLLSPAQRTLLPRLSVFCGRFDLAAAQAVCGFQDAEQPAIVEIGDEINALLDQSLLAREAPSSQAHLTDGCCPQCPVQQRHEDEDNESRFIMLETVRDFSLAQLRKSGESAQLHQRHADYFAGRTRYAATQLHGPVQALTLIWLEHNSDNLRAALTWLLDTEQIEPAAEMGCALSVFWQRHGHYDEGRRWMDSIIAVMAQFPVPAMLRARTLQAAALLAYRQGDWQRAQPWLAECNAIFTAAGDLRGQASVNFDQGWIAIDRGDWQLAARLNRKSLALARKAGDELITYRALTNLGWTHLCTHEYAAAAPLFEEAHRAAQKMQHTKGIAVSLINLGWVAHYTGEPMQAQSLAQAGLRLCCRLDERELIAECLELLAITTIDSGDAHRAARLSGAAAALRAALHIIHPPSHHVATAMAAAEEAMRHQLNNGDLAADRQAGSSLRIEAMIVFALGCGRKQTSVHATTARGPAPPSRW